jgi:hypothetical protein
MINVMSDKAIFHQQSFSSVENGGNMMYAVGGHHMRRASIVSVFLLFLTNTGNPQVVRLPGGGCSVDRSGLMTCSWLGPSRDAGPVFRVNQYGLAPQAPLTVEFPNDTILLALDEGILLDETQSPEERISVFRGTGLLVPKGKKVVLRNIGEKSLALVEIVLHQSS